MYRTEKTKELVLKGIPESMRGELWLLFSGEQTPRDRTQHASCSHSIKTTRDAYIMQVSPVPLKLETHSRWET